MLWQMLIGHFVGDYLLQSAWMAFNKPLNTLKGWLAAFVHSLVYTFSVCLFMNNYDLTWVIAVFISHFPIDKFSLGEIYMRHVRGYGIQDYLEDDRYKDNQKLNSIAGSFISIIYVVTDNTLHILVMYLAYVLIY